MQRVAQAVKTVTARIILPAFLLAFILPYQLHAEEGLVESLSRILKNRPKGTEVSLSVLEVDGNSVTDVFHSNENKPLIPASIQKLVIAAAAIKHLGPEFRFKTEVFVDGRSGGAVERLIVVGGGDPSLAIEQSYLIAKAIKRRGIQKINELVLDGSRFVGRSAQGERAFDAALSPLSFNFNSIFFEVCPGPTTGKAAQVGIDVPADLVVLKNQIVTGPEKPINITLSGDGRTYLLSGAIPLGAMCRGFYRAVSEPGVYFAATLAAQLREIGVSVSLEKVSRNSMTHGKSEYLYSHQSTPLAELVYQMNHFSTNSYADHLVFALADQLAGGFQQWEKGLEVLNEFVKSEPFNCEQCDFADGSGLSRSNKVTTRFMTSLLAHHLLDTSLSPDFQAGLPAPGRTGSLEERSVDFGEVVFRAKTGTLTGVRSLAGFVYLKNGKSLVFSLIQNNLPSREAGYNLEEAVVKVLGAKDSR
jgi:D-alanyl-D-alanine carboxypeptidase/D-alanyl-D-alanine-endopeptidase (penicillin-binding protein 4)